MTDQYCTFRLGELQLAIPVEEVQEVIREQEITRVPLAPATVRGLINLRGQIVTVIDLRTRLGLPPIEVADLHVVLRRGFGGASLLVDDIGDVLEFAEHTAAPPPRTLEGVLRQLVAKVHKLERGLLLVLDSERVTNLSLQGAS